MKRIAFLTVVMALLLSACAQATPTMDPAQIQASAVAAANTMVALTQASVPTETPVPPTPLPSPTALPSPTLLALPTLAIDLSATVPALPTLGTGGQSGAGNSGGAGNASGDPCQAPMSAKPSGPQATVRLQNATKGSVVLSLYLSKNDFGECGYVSRVLDSGASTSITIPVGCYSAGAFVNDPKKPSKSFGYGCFKDPTGNSVVVGPDVIKVNQ